MTTTRMLHEIDPRQAIWDRLGSVDHIKMMHNQVLVATYIRPEKSIGGIIMPHSVRKEDEYQGKVGMVIAKGPLAFVNDSRTDFAGQDVEIGQWVAYRMSDGWQMNLKGRTTMENPNGEYHCRVLLDVDIKAILTSPDDVI